jgi:hypothetical protein
MASSTKRWGELFCIICRARNNRTQTVKYYCIAGIECWPATTSIFAMPGVRVVWLHICYELQYFCDLLSSVLPGSNFVVNCRFADLSNVSKVHAIIEDVRCHCLLKLQKYADSTCAGRQSEASDGGKYIDCHRKHRLGCRAGESWAGVLYSRQTGESYGLHRKRLHHS